MPIINPQPRLASAVTSRLPCVTVTVPLCATAGELHGAAMLPGDRCGQQFLVGVAIAFGPLHSNK